MYWVVIFLVSTYYQCIYSASWFGYQNQRYAYDFAQQYSDRMDRFDDGEDRNVYESCITINLESSVLFGDVTFPRNYRFYPHTISIQEALDSTFNNGTEYQLKDSNAAAFVNECDAENIYFITIHDALLNNNANDDLEDINEDAKETIICRTNNETQIVTSNKWYYFDFLDTQWKTINWINDEEYYFRNAFTKTEKVACINGIHIRLESKTQNVQQVQDRFDPQYAKLHNYYDSRMSMTFYLTDQQGVLCHGYTNMNAFDGCDQANVVDDGSAPLSHSYGNDRCQIQFHPSYNQSRINIYLKTGESYSDVFTDNCKFPILYHYERVLNLPKVNPSKPTVLINGMDDEKTTPDLWTIIVPNNEDMYRNMGFKWTAIYSKRSKKIQILQIQNSACYDTWNRIKVAGVGDNPRIITNKLTRYNNSDVVLRKEHNYGKYVYSHLISGADQRLKQWTESVIVRPQALKDCDVRRIHHYLVSTQNSPLIATIKPCRRLLFR